jgi:hypothetical protein
VFAAVELLAVLEPEDRGAQPLLLLAALRREAAQDVDAVVDHLADARVARVALVLELRLGQQTLRAAGVPGQEHEVALARPIAPRQVERGGVGRLAVDVRAAEREVDRVARVDEVVGVAAEVRDLQVRRHHEPHVVEDAVLVELPHAALEELDDLRLEPGVGLLRVGEDAFAVLGAHRFGGFGGRALGEALRHRLRDVGHLDELLHGEVGDAHLVRESAGDEAVAHPVVVALHLGDAVAHAVVVGQDQTLRRHERRRAAAAEAQRREAHGVPPLLVELDAVLALQVGERRAFERPHLAEAEFVLGASGGGECEGGGEEPGACVVHGVHFPTAAFCCACHFASSSFSRSGLTPVANGLSPRSVFAHCSVSRIVSAIARKRMPLSTARWLATTLRPSRGIHSGISR